MSSIGFSKVVKGSTTPRAVQLFTGGAFPSPALPCDVESKPYNNC